MSLRDSAIVAYAETEVMELSDRDVWELDAEIDRKSTRLNSSHVSESRMPSSA